MHAGFCQQWTRKGAEEKKTTKKNVGVHGGAVRPRLSLPLLGGLGNAEKEENQKTGKEKKKTRILGTNC